MGRAKLFSFLTAVIALAACQTAEKHKPTVQAPVAALAPKPLPLRQSELPVRSFYAPIPDAVDVLVGQVESLYAAGMSDCRSGNLAKAKEEFDQALGLLLESKLDVESDDRLNAEFDRVVENIHGVELSAIEHGDTLSEHRYEPAPIESFAGLTFPVDPKVKERVQKEIQSVRSDLPLVSNDYVDGFISYFQNRGRKFIQTVLERSSVYQPMISEALRKEGLPQDLIYLAAAESAFNPFALSHAGAKGIWQLMLSRATEYGLKKDRWVDEREDPVKSTRAAVRHLKDLYQTFGDWFLAMAAYDCGPINVQRAIEKTGYADFWSLRKLHALPTETENYVPIILATALIGKNPQAYGFDVQPESPLPAEQVIVNVPTDLRLVAQLIDRPVEELTRLNPSLLQWTTPVNDPEFVLNLPAGTRETYEQAIAAIPPDKRIWWRAHKVEEGETLSHLAKRFGISTVALAQVNQIKWDASLVEGVRLLVPLAAGRESSLARVRAPGSRRAYRYQVRAGDTLELIADRFDVTPFQIRRWNNLRTSRLVPGKSLKVYVVAGGGGDSRRHRTRRHRVPAHAYRLKNEKPPTDTFHASKGSGPFPKAVTPGPWAAR